MGILEPPHLIHLELLCLCVSDSKATSTASGNLIKWAKEMAESESQEMAWILDMCINNNKNLLCWDVWESFKSLLILIVLNHHIIISLSSFREQICISQRPGYSHQELQWMVFPICDGCLYDMKPSVSIIWCLFANTVEILQEEQRKSRGFFCAQGQGFQKITDHLRWISIIYPQIYKGKPEDVNT